MDYMTYDKNGKWVKVTEKTRESAIAKGKRTEKSFIPVDEFTADIADMDPVVYLKPAESATDRTGNVFNRIIENKQEVIDILAPLYKGNINDLNI